MAVAASVLGLSSSQPACLLAGPFAPEDAEFRPLRPPVILEGAQTFPLPDRFVAVPPPPNETVGFRVCIAYESRGPLSVRVFIDRARPCIAGANCGTALLEENVPFVDAGPCRVYSFSVTVSNITALAGRQCMPVDLYVSSAWKSLINPTTAHLPDRVGDVAHARWYLVRSGSVPTIDQCCANYGASQATLVEQCTN